MAILYCPQAYGGSITIMLQFLSALFTSTDKPVSGIDEALINKAIDRAIDGTDVRLRGLGNYRKQLREPVSKAVAYIINMVDDLPQPAEISRNTFSNDPRIHAFFASFNHLQENVGGAQTVRDYINQSDVDKSSRIYGLLTMEWEQISRLGTVLQDDRIQREVMQEAVNFFNHRYLGPSTSVDETTRNIKRRIFDYVVEEALEKIISEKSRRSELELQKKLLNRKLQAMKAGNWGLEEMLSPEIHEHPDFVALSDEIESIETELSSLGASHEALARNMKTIQETLASPDRLISSHTISMTLDSMNIKTDADSPSKTFSFELIEVFSETGETRIILPGWFPADELPPETDFITEAKRYL